MRQLVILSGKGGTGKTTVASAMIRLSQARAYADCDVDAPNLALVTPQCEKTQTEAYFDLGKAVIQSDICISCGICAAHCRFDAIVSNPVYHVDSLRCEGCGVCERLCPVKAISMAAHQAGTMTLCLDSDWVFSTAQLKMGSGTTGKLVSEVKKRMNLASDESIPFAIIDGSPGIGCPVIASLSGASLTLIVAEPSISGMSDLTRIVETARGMGTDIAICVNKADLNPAKTEDIRRYCKKEEIDFVGTIPYDKQVFNALNRGESIADISSPAGFAVREVYEKTMIKLLTI